MDVRHLFVRRAWRQWDLLLAEHILSPLLSQRFIRTYRNYMPCTEEEVFARTDYFPAPLSMSYKSGIRDAGADPRELLSLPVTLPKLVPKRPICPTRSLATPISELVAPTRMYLPARLPPVTVKKVRFLTDGN